MAPHRKRNTKVPKNQTIDQLLSEALAKCQPSPDDPRPVLIFIAGPNGSGKTSIFQLVQQMVGAIDFVNADLLAKVFADVPAPDEFAQKVANLMREHCLLHSRSFATESVFSDEVGDKPSYLLRAEALGFRVVFIYVAIASAALSMARVAARVANGGHPVPFQKLERRYTASMGNCRRVLRFVETGILLENSHDLDTTPFRPMAMTSHGRVTFRAANLPAYLSTILPNGDQPPASG